MKLRLSRLFISPLVGAGFIPALAFILIIFIWFTYLCLPTDLFPKTYSIVINDRDGNLLSAGIAADGQWRFPGHDDLPEKFIAAITTYEDKRFYSHNGIDILALGRAIRLNFMEQRIVSGASTLTMQVLRLQREGQARIYSEKIMEMLLALRITLRYDKTEVLRLFASHAPFGGNVVGIEAASWRYFGRSPDNLGWADAAMLAVLPNSPGLIHPGKNREELLTKRNRLLMTLEEKGFMDKSALSLAMDEPIPQNPVPLPRHAPHLLSRMLKQGVGALTPPTGDGAISTTIDGNLQRQLNVLCEKYSEQLSSRGIENLGVLVIETKTGEVAAYTGNGPLDKVRNSYVDMVTATRSTGSLLKPFLYAGMIDAGELLPRQLVLDVPTRMGAYMPENPTHIYLGAVRADNALAQSLNVPAARLLKEFGVNRFYGLLEDMGMNTLIRSADGYGVSLVLGGSEGSLENLVSMYSSLGREILNNSPEKALFNPIYFPDGPAAAAQDSPLHPGSARIVLKAMEELVRPEAEIGWKNFMSSKQVSWKTGTSYGFRDAWAIGVTPGYTVGVWVGNATGEGKPGIQGTKAAAPLLFQVLERLDTQGDFSWPSGMVEAEVCTKSGYLAGPDCPESELILLPPTPGAGRVCPYHRLIHLDPTGNYQVTTKEEAGHRIRQESWFVLPPVAEWYYSRWNIDYTPLPPHKNENKSVDNAPMALPFPTENDEFYIPVDMDGKPGLAVFEVFHREAGRTLFWHLDDDYLGQTTDIHQFELRPKKGPHTLTLVDDRGAVLSRRFTLLSD
ncbi:MAG: penicillin-binding protein 1C [Spirochaetales bacterium]|nr:penicillin-binding protein 1C [Spirochaetales bacterium]